MSQNVAEAIYGLLPCFSLTDTLCYSSARSPLKEFFYVLPAIATGISSLALARFADKAREEESR